MIILTAHIFYVKVVVTQSIACAAYRLCPFAKAACRFPEDGVQVLLKVSSDATGLWVEKSTADG
jgi:hypothetical protein